ncbi:MAG: pitrilysin family protein [Oligoflexia bacterium]|nr:pitrilysin family protein [Oligoflexia bacterium]
MKRKHIVFLILFGIVLFIGFMAYVKYQRSEYKEAQVESGLKMLFLKDDSLPFIQFSVVFPKAGSDYDFEGKSGLAQLTAYMLDQGAGGLNSESLQEELNQLGTELSVSVGRQTARFSISGLSWHKEKLYDLFKKILSRPHFESSEMEILRKQFIDRRIKSLDRADFVADTLLRSALFQGSVSSAGAGNLISLPKINLEDIRAFYKKYYLEGNPIFMIVGDFDKTLEKSARAFVNDSFPYQKQSFDFISAPDLDSQIKLVTNNDLVQAEVRLAYSLFPFPTQNPRQFLVFKLANSILGAGGMTSRLFYELREKRGLTYGAYSSVNFGKLYGFFDISGATKTSSVKEFLEQTFLILNKFKQEGASLEELNTAKQTVKIRHLKKIETPENNLYQTAYYKYYLGLDSGFLDHYLQTIADISLEEVNLGIKEFILSKPLQIIIYGHPSLQSQLEDIKDFSLSTVSFKDYFKDELNFIQPSSQSK